MRIAGYWTDPPSGLCRVIGQHVVNRIEVRKCVLSGMASHAYLSIVVILLSFLYCH